MARFRIVNYTAGWNLKMKMGLLRFQETGGSWSPVYPVANPSEFSAIVDLLRNENPVYHDPDAGIVSTAAEPVGEGE